MTQHCPWGYKTQQQNNGVASLIAALDNILCGPQIKRSFVYYNLFIVCFIANLSVLSYLNKRLRREINIYHDWVQRQKGAQSAALCCLYSPVGNAHAWKLWISTWFLLYYIVSSILPYPISVSVYNQWLLNGSHLHRQFQNKNTFQQNGSTDCCDALSI